MRRLRIDSHQHLLERIEAPARRARVKKLLQLCMGSLGALARLDVAIFERRQRSADGRGLLEILTAADAGEGEATEAVAQLEALAEIVWGPADALHQVITELFAEFMPEDDGDGENLDFDAAFDEAPPPEPAGEGDIDDALDLLSDASELHPASNAELALALVPLASALRGQITNSKRRLREAITEGRRRQALQDIDESRRETSEAIFAIVESVFAAHKLRPGRDAILPGVLSDLDQALQIRREFAMLHRFVRGENEAVQDLDRDVDDRNSAVVAIRDRVNDVTKSEVFRHMRASDRFQILAFQNELAAATANTGRLSCEGLTKYLESLGAVNQREVIVRHDQAVMGSVRTHVDSARPMFELSPDAAREVIESAFADAEKLAGWQESLDGLVARWRLHDVSARAEAELHEMLDELSALIPTS